ncbi:hypothetical protein H4219_004463 [Mycoemilia scoparia]|uniref:DC-UbP/UBTD2 N-terminal domain-containing protein n=1 Tax=Mycoemilia scoparia TaxID=417184 RepID=A0A9W8DMT8_9FUNG|nr:hypothetical protein H4219_004463 [Mycoemilia scoparia]
MGCCFSSTLERDLLLVNDQYHAPEGFATSGGRAILFNRYDNTHGARRGAQRARGTRGTARRRRGGANNGSSGSSSQANNSDIDETTNHNVVSHHEDDDDGNQSQRNRRRRQRRRRHHYPQYSHYPHGRYYREIDEYEGLTNTPNTPHNGRIDSTGNNNNNSSSSVSQQTIAQPPILRRRNTNGRRRHPGHDVFLCGGTTTSAGTGNNVNSPTTITTTTTMTTTITTLPIFATSSNRDVNPRDIDLGKSLRWKAKPALTLRELENQRRIFWETAPAYEGRAEIWQALEQICTTNDEIFAAAIIESANIKVPTGRLYDGCYDELGNRYLIPSYCFSIPSNIIKTDNATDTTTTTNTTTNNGGGGITPVYIRNTLTNQTIITPSPSTNNNNNNNNGSTGGDVVQRDDMTVISADGFLDDQKMNAYIDDLIKENKDDKTIEVKFKVLEDKEGKAQAPLQGKKEVTWEDKETDAEDSAEDRGEAEKEKDKEDGAFEHFETEDTAFEGFEVYVDRIPHEAAKDCGQPTPPLECHAA